MKAILSSEPCHHPAGRLVWRLPTPSAVASVVPQNAEETLAAVASTVSRTTAEAPTAVALAASQHTEETLSAVASVVFPNTEETLSAVVSVVFPNTEETLSAVASVVFPDAKKVRKSPCRRVPENQRKSLVHEHTTSPTLMRWAMVLASHGSVAARGAEG